MKQNAIIECPECGTTMPAAARTCFACGFERAPAQTSMENTQEGAPNGCAQEQIITCNGPVKLIIQVVPVREPLEADR